MAKKWPELVVKRPFGQLQILVIRLYFRPGRGIISRLPRPPFLKVLFFMPCKLAWQKLLTIGFVKPYKDFDIRNNFTQTLMKLLTKFQNNN